MPLTIGRRAGQDFYIDDTRVLVEEVHPSEDDADRHFTLVIGEDEERREILITHERAAEILPDVHVSAGDGFYTQDRGRGQVDTASICIAAPHEIIILRGELYHQKDPRGAVED